MTARTCPMCNAEIPVRLGAGRKREWCSERCKDNAKQQKRRWDDTPLHVGCGGRLRASWVTISAEVAPVVPPLVLCDKCRTLYPAGDGPWSAPNPWPGIRPKSLTVSSLVDPVRQANAQRFRRTSWQGSDDVIYALSVQYLPGEGVFWSLYEDDVDTHGGELPDGSGPSDVLAVVRGWVKTRIPDDDDLQWDRGLW